MTRQPLTCPPDDVPPRGSITPHPHVTGSIKKNTTPRIQQLTSSDFGLFLTLIRAPLHTRIAKTVGTSSYMNKSPLVRFLGLISSYSSVGGWSSHVQKIILVGNLSTGTPTTSGFEIVKIPTVEIWTVPNSGKGNKATYILTWENSFPVKVFFLIWVKTLEK